MLRMILSYGALAGVLAGIPLSAIVIGMIDAPPPPAIGMAIGYLIMLVALSTIFVAIKRRRDQDLGGVIRFWPAFGLGAGISFIAGLIYVVAWESSIAVTGADFAGSYADSILATARAEGASADALARTMAEMEAFKRDYANPAFRLPMIFSEIFPVGLLVSLISAALLRNPRFMSARQPAGRPAL